MIPEKHFSYCGSTLNIKDGIAIYEKDRYQALTVLG